MVGTTILHYHIKEELGRGGMGVVYKAEDTKLKREVAIKFLPRHIAASEEERERFKIEAQAAAALNHPNITTIYAIEEHDDELFIVMEFIEGQELRKLLIDNGQLSIENCLNIATQIAEGLQAAHAKGIVHRDIKSSNIMITEDGKVKIMDFGLAKMANPSSSRHLTRQNTTLGTVPYMSPEQVTGAPIDQRSDIWSLGIIVYEMITGQLPFQQPYEAAELYAIVNDPYPSPLEHNPNLPPVLMTLLEGALAKLPEERFQNMEEVLGCLRVRPISERGGENPERRSQEEKVGKKESISTLTSHRQFLISGAVLLVLAVLIFLISRNLLQRNSPLPV
ncbi:MAG: serine/threonine protein kinase, partial [Methanobacteriota archaeon]